MSGDATLYENATFIWVQNFEEPNDYPLMNSFDLVVALEVLYLSMVLKLLPDFMDNRKPFQLRTPLVIFNAFEVVASSYFVYLGMEIFIDKGILPTIPMEEDVDTRKKMIFLLYVFFLSKITEFMDTIFFVLRKKYNQVTFLHVYHHAATMVGTWCLAKYAATSSAVFCASINSLVHVVMYFYYGVSALGPRYAKYMTWKKYITTFQLVQFVCMFLHQFLALVIQKGKKPISGAAYILFSTVFFIYLFSKFYQQSYNKLNKLTSETKNGVLKRNDEKTKTQ